MGALPITSFICHTCFNKVALFKYLVEVEIVVVPSSLMVALYIILLIKQLPFKGQLAKSLQLHMLF